ncbi:MAG: hypothetical protein Q8Q06_00555 [bacterium]|nr:hypothetical protein [bacterium]
MGFETPTIKEEKKEMPEEGQKSVEAEIKEPAGFENLNLSETEKRQIEIADKIALAEENMAEASPVSPEGKSVKSKRRAGFRTTTFLALGLVLLGGGAPSAEAGSGGGGNSVKTESVWKKIGRGISKGSRASIEIQENVEASRNRIEYAQQRMEYEQLRMDEQKIEMAKRPLYNQIRIIHEDFAREDRQIRTDNSGGDYKITDQLVETARQGRDNRLREVEDKIRELENLAQELRFNVENRRLDRDLRRAQRQATIERIKIITEIPRIIRN